MVVSVRNFYESLIASVECRVNEGISVVVWRHDRWPRRGRRYVRTVVGKARSHGPR